MTEQPLQVLIGRSLAILRAELPRAYYRLAQEIGSRRATLTIDGEAVHLAGAPFEVRLLPNLEGEPPGEPPGEPEVELATSRQTILDVLDARLTLAQGLAGGRIVVRAEVADLEAFHQALLLYVRGAVRCPSFPALVAELRALSSPPPTAGTSP